MTLKDDITQYYDAISSGYDKSAGYTNPEAEELRKPIKERFQEIIRGKDVLEIACGTGYWTQVIAVTAKSVLATDINPSMITIAADRSAKLSNVRFLIADAYTLDNVPEGFNAAFTHWWWSHIPRDLIKPFLNALHSKLKPGSTVFFRDHLGYAGFKKSNEIDGNNMEIRKIPDGGTVNVVKNYPSKEELLAALSGIADDVRYSEYPEENSWDVIYKTR
jgi:SAM-dependent methyltransferase